jgi:hypothetical protein
MVPVAGSVGAVALGLVHCTWKRTVAPSGSVVQSIVPGCGTGAVDPHLQVVAHNSTGTTLPAQPNWIEKQHNAGTPTVESAVTHT